MQINLFVSSFPVFVHRYIQFNSNAKIFFLVDVFYGSPLDITCYLELYEWPNKTLFSKNFNYNLGNENCSNTFPNSLKVLYFTRSFFCLFDSEDTTWANLFYNRKWLNEIKRIRLLLNNVSTSNCWTNDHSYWFFTILILCFFSRYILNQCVSFIDVFFNYNYMFFFFSGAKYSFPSFDNSSF